MSYCSQYGSKTVGKCIHFINQYCGLRVAENCVFSGESVDLTGGNKATITFDNNGNPFFNFYEGPLKRYYTNTQIAKQTDIIKHLPLQPKGLQ